MHLSQFCFHMFNFVSRGGVKNARKNFKIKIIPFYAVSKYGMLLFCENFRKNDTYSIYRRANPKNPVFSILRRFKMHN